MYFWLILSITAEHLISTFSRPSVSPPPPLPTGINDVCDMELLASLSPHRRPRYYPRAFGLTLLAVAALSSTSWLLTLRPAPAERSLLARKDDDQVYIYIMLITGPVNRMLTFP